MASRKVTLLLADEDALRRDGLAAVLHATEQFEVSALVSDGEAALQEIRRNRPDIAIVDLNLPKLHGIELIRRVRSEVLHTSMVVLAGTGDDETVRAVVRGGGDGYLLHTETGRQLIEALCCIEDGGQYFSPHLNRNERQRRVADSDHRDDRMMEVMADGIRPVLDRLDAIEGRVAQRSRQTRLSEDGNSVQLELVQRVSALEQDMNMQADAMNQLRAYSLRTEDNLSRLISGMDKLAQELPRRITAAGQESIHPVTPAPERSDGRSLRLIWSVLGALIILTVVAWAAASMASHRINSAPAVAQQMAPGGQKPRPPSAAADTSTKLLAAQQYSDRKDYALAEDIYKQIVAAEPNNVDALKGLASVLYREDKVDESAAILDQIKN